MTDEDRARNVPGLDCFDRNLDGRDYVVGDVHGCFDLLAALLARVGFDEQRDRLFSLGDLIDRGPQSAQVAAWLAQPWFHAIRGNHEAMLLDAVIADGWSLRQGPDTPLWRMNGGGWFFDLSGEEQLGIHRAVSELGLAFEVALPDGGRAALVHADVLDDSWPATRAFLTGEETLRDAGDAMMQLLWSRVRAEAVARPRRREAAGGKSCDVAGVDVIFFGHTPMRTPVARGNTRWVDTGAAHGGRLSLARISVDGPVWSIPVDAGELSNGWN